MRHAGLILLEHVAHPCPKLFVSMCPHIGLVKDWRSLAWRAGRAQKFVHRQHCRPAIWAVARRAETIVGFISRREYTHERTDRPHPFFAQHVFSPGHAAL